MAAVGFHKWYVCEWDSGHSTTVTRSPWRAEGEQNSDGVTPSPATALALQFASICLQCFIELRWVGCFVPSPFELAASAPFRYSWYLSHLARFSTWISEPRRLTTEPRGLTRPCRQWFWSSVRDLCEEYDGTSKKRSDRQKVKAKGFGRSNVSKFKCWKVAFWHLLAEVKWLRTAKAQQPHRTGRSSVALHWKKPFGGDMAAICLMLQPENRELSHELFFLRHKLSCYKVIKKTFVILSYYVYNQTFLGHKASHSNQGQLVASKARLKRIRPPAKQTIKEEFTTVWFILLLKTYII